MRRPSLAKHRRLTRAPARADARHRMQMAGDLASSAAAAARGGTSSGADRTACGEACRRCRSPDRDRDCRRSRSSRGRAAARDSVARSCRAEPLRAVAVVKAVAERDHRARLVAHDRPRTAAPASRRCRKAAAARRGARSSSLFRDAGRRPQAGVPPANRARRPDRRQALRRAVRSRRSGNPAVSRRRSVTHRLLHQLVRGLRQQRVGRLAVNRLAADFEHHRNRERRHVLQRLMDDSAPDAREHFAEPLISSRPVAASARAARSSMWSGWCLRSTS